MRIAVCDDERNEREHLVDVIRKTIERGRDCEIDCYVSGEELLSSIDNGVESYDIIFLDIYMDGMNGTKAAKLLKEKCPQTEIVFVTTSREHALEAFSVRALHYLLKPVTVEGVAEVFDRINISREPASIILKIGRDELKVPQPSIQYIQSNRNKTTVCTIQEIFEVNEPLAELVKRLDESFMELQRGIVVNMEFIHEMHSDSCQLNDGRTILLSRGKRADLRKQYHEYMFYKVRNM